MGKKGLIFAVSLLAITSALSWAGSAWQVQTKVTSTGGSLKVRNNVSQTAAGSIAYANLTTSADVPVSVAANSGYRISGLTRNGGAVALGNFSSHYTTTFNKANGSVQSLIASFATKQIAVGTAVTGPGSITPASYQVNYNGSMVLTATPTFTNGIISALTVNGTPYPGVPCTGALKVTIPNITAATTVAATFAAVTADAGAPQMVTTNSVVTLKGSSSGGASTTWSQLSGPAILDTSGWTTLTPSFQPSVPGVYVFQLNASVAAKILATATTQVTVTASTTNYLRTTCNGCHGPTGLLPSQAFGVWSASKHKVRNVNCVTCHSNGTMPSAVNTSTVNATSFLITGAAAGPVGAVYCLNCHQPAIVSDFNASPHRTKGAIACIDCHSKGIHNTSVPTTACNRCHLDGNGNVARHPVAIGTSTCVTCHDPHTTVGTVAGATAAHYNNMTGAGYPASYVTSRSTCMDCHFADAGNNATVRNEWSQSRHAAVKDTPWIAYDFKTRAGCVQCHTTTGFIAYSSAKVTAAWGVASDKTKEVLTCIGCHSDITTGALRTLTPVKPFADDSYVNRNVAASNACMNCHGGRNNGASIQVKVGVADFTNTAFVAPHYLAAGSTLQGKGGYHFPGQTYAFYSSNSHRLAGMGNTMNTGSTGPCVACHMTAPQKHLYQAATLDANGVVTGIPTNICSNCHAASMGATSLSADQAAFNNAMNVLNATLADKGFVYSTNYPYFAATNWGVGQAGANVMGAAFNYKLLLAEPGAYAHNSGYARRLITDSIDAAYNGGTVTGSIVSALDYLVKNNKISQQAADDMAAYQGTPSCTSCHPIAGLSGAHAAHVGNLAPTAYGDTDNRSTSTEYRFGCANCHPTDLASHLDGQVEVTLVPINDGSLRGLNKQGIVAGGVGIAGSGITGTAGSSVVCSASYCHSSGGVNASFASSPDWYKASAYTGDKCAMCHANAPSTGAHASHAISIHNGIVADAAGNLIAAHGDPAQATTISCDTCHSGTVINAANDKNALCASCHTANLKGTPVLDKSLHLNGSVNVFFKNAKVISKAQVKPDAFGSYSGIWTRTTYKAGAGSFDTSKLSLAQGSWNPDKSCSNVACHNGGTPKWNGKLSCVDCHSAL